jgi:hypothetical protein
MAAAVVGAKEEFRRLFMRPSLSIDTGNRASHFKNVRRTLFCSVRLSVTATAEAAARDKLIQRSVSTITRTVIIQAANERGSTLVALNVPC